MHMKRSLFAVLALGAALFALPAIAADVAAAVGAPTTKALQYNYPSLKCGLYYGVNTLGSTGAVENAEVGTQMVQGAIGLTLGYTCPMGPGYAGYWFVDGHFDFANLNGKSNGLNLTGPAVFEQRFGFGAPVDMIMGMIPGLSTLHNALPSLMPLPSGVAVVTSNPYLFASITEEDVGVSNGLAANKQWLVSAGFGLGNKVRLSNGVVFDPFVEYLLPSSQMCFGPIASGCTKIGNRVKVGAAIEF